MDFLNLLLTRAFNAAMYPMASKPLVGLIIVSAIMGVAMTYLFGKLSPQKRLQRVVDQSRAQLLGLHLFKDDLSVTFRCQVKLLKVLILRFLYSLPALLVLAVPSVLILTQLALHFEHRPLKPGEQVVVALKLASTSWDRYRDLQITARTNVILETPPLRDAAAHTIYWRVRASEPSYAIPLRWQVGDEIFEKQLVIAAETEPIVAISICRPAGHDWTDRLLNPAESSFDIESPVQKISVNYPLRRTRLFGWDLPWWGTLLIVSILASFVARRFLGVRF